MQRIALLLFSVPDKRETLLANCVRVQRKTRFYHLVILFKEHRTTLFV